LTPIQNTLILDAALGNKTQRVPVWLMRQAGRVLPQYKEVRKKAGSFLTMLKNKDMVSEVTIQPVDYYNVDAAIIFSDILVIPEAMGLPYKMVESKGPIFEQTVSNLSEMRSLHIANSNDYNYVIDAIKQTKKDLNQRVPLIGFAGAPFTIYAYMTEGSGSKTFSKAKALLYSDPEFAHTLLQKITQSTIAYLIDQIKAGVDLIQIFDSWAGILSPQQYTTFSYNYINEICIEIKKEYPTIPIIVFAKGAFFARQQFAQLPCNVVGLDWNMDAKESRSLIGNNKTLQGNIDPCALYGSYKSIELEVEKMMNSFGKDRYIANLGHGLYPDLEKEKVKFFVETIQNFKYNE
jgi:uroporphyrinogen decarboxylase